MKKLFVFKGIIAAIVVMFAVSLTSCKKSEKETPPATPEIESLDFDKKSKNIHIRVGEELELGYSFSPDEITDTPSVTFSSDNKDVAIVDENGVVTGVENGEAKITITTEDGEFYDECYVLVGGIIKMTRTSVDIKFLVTVEKEEDKSSCWVDLNANGKRDEGEEITEFGSTATYDHSKSQQELTIYGRFIKFSCVSTATAMAKQLDVSKCPSLEMLLCNKNELTELDLSNNPNLTTLFCQNNKITKLLVNSSAPFKEIWCLNNQIKGENMTNFINSLTDEEREPGFLRRLFLVSLKEDGMEGNAYTTKDLEALRDKRCWSAKVLKKEGGYEDIPLPEYPAI